MWDQTMFDISWCVVYWYEKVAHCVIAIATLTQNHEN
jgi:hypothetical protein